MEYSIIELQEKLKYILPPKRFIHSLGVQYTCANLAMRYGCDIQKAQIAGLLHDCAKYMPDEEMLTLCRKNFIPVTETEEKSAFLLHAKLGAFFAENVYNISDKDIIDAITYHTTGKPDMTLLEKIVYVADYIEPSRKRIHGLKKIRKISYDSLDEATYLILESTLNFLQKESTREIDPRTKKAFEYYKYLNTH
ncbi:putative HD superfamily hydrolase involved in NAD metabolism [Mobilisporobacter senegalensis]|uniref:bis(5'-nucleosyl)-tetraphosphatase (symmetrical) n=1 Tax=Mobilisporobacter senegalensis TaxID=1329262 RepID=A0A3N1XSY6_9FIRM|nr:bis(5'-nucleosyl)-tetraphosphatase (symmetrical) YqeK [Mobilisporobacter senegalensis]ROR29261.1 putative HD superfamily hydrolase involved in NAD metabolism [Mobilisporobacter senegalensis]